MGIQERKIREKERRRLSILVAAKRVFRNKGFGQATMEDIAGEAELSAGTLYLYFKNKNELYASLSLRVLEFLIIRLEQLHQVDDDDGRAKLDDIKNALIDVYEYDPVVLRSLFVLQSSDFLKHLSADLVHEITTLGKKSIQSLAALFKQAIQKGVCRNIHPTVIANVVWSLFTGVVMLEFSRQDIEKKHDQFKPQMESAFDIFARGIAMGTEGGL